MRLAVAAALALWTGTTLLLAELRWFQRRPLAVRLAPYLSGSARTARGAAGANRAGVLSVGSVREVVGPLASSIGGSLARLAGVEEPLAIRLRRIHSSDDPTSFRVRQLGWTGAGFLGGAAATVVLAPRPVIGLVVVLGATALGFLLVEQQLAARSAAWQRRVFLELPVVAEQLGMLLSAGYSLGSALSRLADRGKGACGRDLQRVIGRIRQGLSETDALREWATVADVEALHRLVGILALNRQSADLGRLIGEEARAIRRDVHRQLIETIERRSQQVWIPVTVAALVPGVIFLAVPFVDALSMFANS